MKSYFTFPDKLKRVLLTGILLLITGLGIAQSDRHYKLYSVKSGKEIFPEDIVKDMDDSDVLFFGEEHNDSIGHLLEKEIFYLLHEKFGNRTALSLEMFDRDVQTVMDEYLSGAIREKHFIKDARTWKNFKDYKPMVEYAKEKHIPVICANAAGRYSNLAGRKGQDGLSQLPPASKLHFAPLPYDTATGAYYLKLKGLSEHGPAADTSARKPSQSLPSGFNLISAQSLWDATMAYSVSFYFKQHPGCRIMHVNGRFHSDEGFAVAHQLKKYSPGIRMLIISTFPDESYPNPTWEKFKHLGDYILVTDPAVPRTFTD